MHGILSLKLIKQTHYILTKKILFAQSCGNLIGIILLKVAAIMACLTNPLIVQSDMTLMLEVYSPLFEQVRNAIAPFSEIIKSPDHIHTYRLTPISLWNARATGLTVEQVLERLNSFAKFPVSENVLAKIKEIMERFGLVEIYSENNALLLAIKNIDLMISLSSNEKIYPFFQKQIDTFIFTIRDIDRGRIKQALIKEGYPALDLAGYTEGEKLKSPMTLRAEYSLRPYQKMASDAFLNAGSTIGGSGVIVLPCGSGKTITATSAIVHMQCHTLILTTGVTAVRQWKQELIEKTTMNPEDIGEYSTDTKEIRPITISTYQMLTHRKSKEDDFLHFGHLNKHPWGLIIYDEVHLLPAQVFQFTASLQAVRRLGITATLIREDGREEDVFSLIGPKCFDIPWKEVEEKGWIAKTTCTEIRVTLAQAQKIDYAKVERRFRFRVASENSNKFEAIRRLLQQHSHDQTLIIGQFIEQVERIAHHFNIPLITGKTPQKDRDILYAQFKAGTQQILVVSSVANFAVDLPDASVAIQVSGKFGSRQEEAQRLGRILRPKKDGRTAYFYTLVTEDTEEQEYAFKRQMFLVEQGYSYIIKKDFQ